MSFLSRAAILLQSHPLPPDPFLAREAGLTGQQCRTLEGQGIIEKAGRSPSDGHGRPPWYWRRATGKPDRAPSAKLSLASTRRERAADLAEVSAYLASHPKASTFDVALCCHMGDSHARKLAKMVRK